MKQRIITAVIGIIFIVPIIIYGNWPFVLLAYLLAAIGLYEMVRMFNFKYSLLNFIFCTIFLWAIMYSYQPLFNVLIPFSTMNVVVLFMVILLLMMVISKNKFSFNEASQLFLATLFLAFSFQYVIAVRLISLEAFLFILFTIWSTDSGAYFIGKKFGKRKLWPAISPNKTIGGALGGISFAIILALLFQSIAPFDKSLLSIVLIAITISIFGQLGDLVASAIKRNYNIKDFGSIFPGHGGVLDKLDSFLFILLMMQIVNYFN